MLDNLIRRDIQMLPKYLDKTTFLIHIIIQIPPQASNLPTNRADCVPLTMLL